MTAAASIGVALAAARQRLLAAAGIEQPGLEARLLLADALGCSMAELVGHPERTLPADVTAALERRLARRLRHEPMAYILGRREFWSLSLRVDARVLVPRPNSETLVEAALAAAGGRRDLKSWILALAAAACCWRCCRNCRMPGGSGSMSAKMRWCAPGPTLNFSVWPTGRPSSAPTGPMRCRASSTSSSATRLTLPMTNGQYSTPACVSSSRLRRCAAASTGSPPIGASCRRFTGCCRRKAALLSKLARPRGYRYPKWVHLEACKLLE